jgi:lipoprotein-anchoring transpeptidase ErfK/SrfK
MTGILGMQEVVKKINSALAAAGLLLVAAGCGVAGGVEDPQVSPEPTAAPSKAAPKRAAAFVISPDDGARKVRLDQPVQVGVVGGRLRSVQVTTSDGKPLAGRLNADGTGWISSADLRRDTTYRVAAVATGENGARAEASRTFHTLKPSEIVTAEVTPEPGETYGVAMPVVVTFDRPVKDKAAVEERLRVETSKPVLGAWRWFGDDEVHYRPKKYWPARTDVTVKLNLRGVGTGRGAWGVDDVVHKFRIGRSVVTKVDLFDHNARVYLDGKLARTIPVTGGKAGWRTRDGIKVVLGREMYHRFKNEQINAPEEYDLVAKYAMRVTWTGEFLHTAWWSTWAQGNSNVSHGCVGMNTSNSAWLYNHTQVGDPVDVRSSGEPMAVTGNGYGDWNLSWEDWEKGSALKQVLSEKSEQAGEAVPESRGL